MREPPSRLRVRALLLTGLLAVAFGAVVFRLADLQLVRHDELARLAERQHSKTITLRPRRGPIYDRHGQVLAVSSEVESIYALPGRVPDPAALAARLAPLLEEPAGELAARLKSDRPFVWLRRRVPPQLSQAVRALGLPGIGFIPESLRFYPNRELAAHLLGFEGWDNRGLEGIELAYDGVLAGEPGLALVERDALGREVTAQPTILKPARPGQGVVLTLDATIQYIAERELEAAWRQTRAEAAMAVVMDPRTGELLALAARPTYNPNTYQAAPPEVRRNRAVTDPFEPGSIFKVILAAAALEEGVVRPEDRFYGEEGAITVANRVIHDWRRYGWLTFEEVLRFSSNVGAIKVGLTLGPERYYQYMDAFGFGRLTGSGLPGESRGRLRPSTRWSGLSLASMSIGQEVSVTALQMVTAVAAVANGGRLPVPQVVRAVLDPQGRPVTGFEPQVARQVLSPRTARGLTEILTQVVADGTGRKAAIEGYRVAGKTGTAQKLDPAVRAYSRRPGVLSFVGFVPADDPRLVMLVLLDEPKTVAWGSEAAAPVFAAIGRQVLHYLGVPRSDRPPLAVVRASAAEVVPAAYPGPSPGGPEEPGRMPDLRGRSLREALALLAVHDVQLRVAGKGFVVRQTPAPGEPITPGTLCRLELAPSGHRP
ncbi:MAG: PASTA domain-containing protein [Candidatus Rokubacteria bacterium]|nr:PASTA domain-containing protein [Candidatus Rokubacteria bacterium]